MYDVNQHKPQRMLVGAKLDMRTGRTIFQKPFLYRGPKASLMPNVEAGVVDSFEDLQRSITPQIPGQGERIPYQWYHRQTYTSGTTTQLTFFNATGVITTTNMQLAGAFPSPIYYKLYSIMVYFDFDVSTLNAAGVLTIQGGALNDIVNLSDGVLTFNIAQKDYWQSFIWANPAGAGASGQMSSAGTFTAEDYNVFQQGTLGVPDIRNRNCFWGDITIPHTQNFFARMDWAAAVTLTNGNTDIITALDGYLYRRVL